MSPIAITGIHALNLSIQLKDTDAFKRIIERNEVPYKVAMFKAIESGSIALVMIVDQLHPEPKFDGEFYSIHAAFKGYLDIYNYFDSDFSDFNCYEENMYLYNGRVDKVDLLEINIHDLVSPNVIPIEVCDYLVKTIPHNSSIMTGVLLVYCIHNSNHYVQLRDNHTIYVMDIMFQYATMHNNKTLKLFLLDKFKQTTQYSLFQYSIPRSRFDKQRYLAKESDRSRYDHYLTKSSHDINGGIALNNKGNKDYSALIHSSNISLSVAMFEWHTASCRDMEMDNYFDQVLQCVHQKIDVNYFNKVCD